MNHCYRLIWNEVHNTWVAVCEFARAHGKRSSSSTASVPVLRNMPAHGGHASGHMTAVFRPLSLALALAFSQTAGSDH